MTKPSEKYFICFIDAENCSAKNFRKVWCKLGALEPKLKNAGIYCYGLEKDKGQRLCIWEKETAGIKEVHWHYLKGKPQKNKVDDAVAKNVNELMNSELFARIDVWCFMTSDGDYVDIISKLNERKKTTIVFGKKNASKRLQQACRIFKPWDEKTKII